MELIYADKERKDIDIIHDCEMDIAYGRDENDFECSIALVDHCCNHGYFIYEEESEIGGIIDTIAPDTDNGIVTYAGRTWHGILDSKIIEPDEGYDYYTVDGEANEVIGEIIQRIGLEGLFQADMESSGIEIDNYQFDRYMGAYKGIRKMLIEAGAKLRIRFINGEVILSAVQAIDYSQDEEFDSSQLTFAIERHYHPTNHLICLGAGELAERRVIHLFTDSNGVVQKYSNVDEPVKNHDYILDKSMQILKGLDEVSEVYDYSSAQTVENYIQLESRPDNWDEDYLEYYIQNDDGNFAQIEKKEEDVYRLTEFKPSDWNTKCEKYYTKSEGKYASVGKNESYTELKSKPSDWNIKYSNYHVKKNGEYIKVEPNIK